MNTEYYQKIKPLKLVYQTRTHLQKPGSISLIELYSENNYSEDDDYYGSDAILRIDNYYIDIRVGYEPDIKIENYIGKKTDREIVIWSGAYDYNGQGNDFSTFFIRTHENEPFTLTTFDLDWQIESLSDTKKYRDLETIIMAGALIAKDDYSNANSCYWRYWSFYVSGKGIRKSKIIKKIKHVCAG